MDFATLLGLLLALAAMVAAVFINTESLETVVAMLKLGPIVLIVGSTLGVTIMSYPMSDLRHMPRLLLQAFRTPNLRIPATIDRLVELADMARKNGLLSLQEEVEKAEHPIMKRGLTLLVDGTDSETMRTILTDELSGVHDLDYHRAGIFAAAGGYAPTIGIVGTVMELVHVLGNMSEPSKLGAAISAAFLATFYGIFTANYVWLPIASKLKGQIAAQEKVGSMIIEGLIMIQQGQSSRFIRERMEGFFPAMPAKGGGK